jgi:[ribosomal protein S18]-alanine N-acetyltransferase
VRRGIRHLFLEVAATNTAAVKLYQKSAFMEIGQRKGYYQEPDGSRHTALTMQAQL